MKCLICFTLGNVNSKIIVKTKERRGRDRAIEREEEMLMFNYVCVCMAISFVVKEDEYIFDNFGETI